MYPVAPALLGAVQGTVGGLQDPGQVLWRQFPDGGQAQTDGHVPGGAAGVGDAQLPHGLAQTLGHMQGMLRRDPVQDHGELLPAVAEDLAVAAAQPPRMAWATRYRQASPSWWPNVSL